MSFALVKTPPLTFLQDRNRIRIFIPAELQNSTSVILKKDLVSFPVKGEEPFALIKIYDRIARRDEPSPLVSQNFGNGFPVAAFVSNSQGCGGVLCCCKGLLGHDRFFTKRRVQEEIPGDYQHHGSNSY